eukprot:CAMPEP_0114555580 /NCGR_PEP_ID=MMETSP0114-20121206/8826_1 /TAXON_ID=31324 /ORGANISM="Goniomonas sp, Strain m" /LENGTH=313 /DNA_ID=CAMNT_0001740717 /DNA_START=1 /DNA_END=942 /DNA_ORIENTATION=-
MVGKSLGPILLLAAVGLCSAADFDLLSAPWTPFHANFSLNLDLVPTLAQMHKRFGVTTVWVAGCMGQWPQLSTAERADLITIWAKEGKAQSLFTICHVGSNDLEEAVELAHHAEQVGCSAIGVIAPSYPGPPSSNQALVQSLKIVADATSLPFYYYHIPAVTRISVPLVETVAAAQAVIPTFAGIKYVEDNIETFRNISAGNLKIFWAANPKLKAMPFGATRFVLAQGYLAPYLLKAANAFAAGDNTEAAHWSDAWDNVMTATRLGDTRCVDKMLGADNGPPRLPLQEVTKEQYDAVHAALEALDFFKIVPTK